MYCVISYDVCRLVFLKALIRVLKILSQCGGVIKQWGNPSQKWANTSSSHHWCCKRLFFIIYWNWLFANPSHKSCCTEALRYLLSVLREASTLSSCLPFVFLSVDYDDGRFDSFTDFSKGIPFQHDNNSWQGGGNSSYGNRLTRHYLSNHHCFPTRKEERTDCETQWADFRFDTRLHRVRRRYPRFGGAYKTLQLRKLMNWTSVWNNFSGDRILFHHQNQVKF